MKDSTPAKKGRKRKGEEKNPIGRPRKKAKDDDSTGTTNNKVKKSAKERKPRKEKAGSSKEKGPVDVERQCGVPLPNGGYCARSLTCKTHSMGAKRAVPGRSQPYDVLLLAYQKRNQVKLASMSTRQQLNLDNEALMEDKPLNEDEEVEQVMTGVLRAHPTPLDRKVMVPTRLRTGFFRMREMLIGALNTVPPLPSAPPANATPQQQHIASVMAATGNVLGRTLVYDTATGRQDVRPPRVFVNTNLTYQQQLLLRKQQQQRMQAQQAQQAQQGQQVSQQGQNQQNIQSLQNHSNLQGSSPAQGVGQSQLVPQQEQLYQGAAQLQGQSPSTQTQSPQMKQSPAGTQIPMQAQSQGQQGQFQQLQQQQLQQRQQAGQGQFQNLQMRGTQLQPQRRPQGRQAPQTINSPQPLEGQLQTQPQAILSSQLPPR